MSERMKRLAEILEDPECNGLEAWLADSSSFELDLCAREADLIGADHAR